MRLRSIVHTVSLILADWLFKWFVRVTCVMFATGFARLALFDDSMLLPSVQSRTCCWAVDSVLTACS